jgi:L-asparaginase
LGVVSVLTKSSTRIAHLKPVQPTIGGVSPLRTPRRLARILLEHLSCPDRAHGARGSVTDSPGSSIAAIDSPANPGSPQRVLIIGLGGTIASLPSPDPSSGVVPSVEASTLARSVPGLGSIARVESRTLRQISSANLSLADMVEVADAIHSAFASGVDGVVVTQGTDNIEETSFAIDLLVPDECPVVVTGAMRNPSLAGADGPANIRAAVTVAASPLASGMGTLVVMNDEVHAARFVRKTHLSSLSAITSPQSGPLGVVVEGRVHFFTRVEALSLVRKIGTIEPIALIRCALGDDGRMVSALAGMGFAGLVVEGFGGGHVPQTMVQPLVELVDVMPVVLASRTGAGVVLESTYGFAGSEIDLLQRGLLSAGALDGLKARVALALVSASTTSRAEAEAGFRLIVEAIG